MSIKMITVRCPFHGEFEILAERPDGLEQVPEQCFLPVENEICGEPLKRVYDAPAVHYKGAGWASKDK